MNRFFPACSLLALATALCGCHSTTKPYDGPEPAATVTMGFHTFDPRSITINAGETVRWDNSSLVWHTVTFDPSKAKEENHVALPAGVEPFDSGKINSNGNYWHTFTTPGVYHYICVPHESKGMAGTVVVQKRNK